MMPPWIEPQFPTLVEKAPAGGGWIHEVKFDGYRMQLRVERGAVALRTRRGHDWTDKFPTLVQAAKKLPNCIIDGELCAVDRDGKSDFAALLASLKGNDSKLVLFCFDMLWSGRNDLRQRPLLERKAALAAAIEKAGSSQLRYSTHFEDNGPGLFTAACRQKLEGIVSKKPDALYKSGKNGSWLKTKCRPNMEFVIGGWAQNGAAFRSLLVGAYEAGRLTYVGRVGTGYGTRVLDELYPKLKQLETKISPFTNRPPESSAEIHFVQPRLVAQVQFADWTGDKLLRQASFKGLRVDKAAKTVTLDG